MTDNVTHLHNGSRHTWPARRPSEARPPASDEDIERWIEEDEARLHSATRTRLVGYALLAALLAAAAAAYIATRP